MEINVRENEEAIMYGQSRDTGNIGYKIQNEDRHNKNTTQEAKTMSHKDHPKTYTQ